MQRLSGTILAILAGLLVVVAAVWAQFHLIGTDRERPTGPELWLAVADEGQRLVVRGSDGAEISLHTAASTPLALNWSPNGEYLAWLELDAGVISLWLWERRSGAPRHFDSGPDDFGAPWWSPDSKYVAVAGPTLVFRRPDGSLSARFPPLDPAIPPQALRVVGWSPDSRWFARFEGTDLVLYPPAGGEPMRPALGQDLSRSLPTLGWRDERTLLFADPAGPLGAVVAFDILTRSFAVEPRTLDEILGASFRRQAREELARTLPEGSSVIGWRTADRRVLYLAWSSPPGVEPATVSAKVAEPAGPEVTVSASPSLLRQRATFDVVLVGPWPTP